ncbi:MAG: hypothetical protein HY925_01980 [Elusimicrobia bacterium]|nr:hypothetical protein [Elusimicrobiota bacterium]
MRVLLAILLLTNGCISVKDSERHRIASQSVYRKAAQESLRETAAGGLAVRSFVYKPRLLPLEGFFKRFARGDFKEAFLRANLRYSPTNADDKALRALLNHGIAPALVEVSNKGAQPLDLSAVRLTLTDSRTTLEPIPNAELPKVFSDFNPKAAAANVYNTGAAVVGCAAALTVLAVGVIAGGDLFGGAGTVGSLPELFDGEVYNELKKTTEVDYDGLLWKPRTLAPGETARGLVFFRAGSADWTALRLDASR